jgi:phospholipase C
LRYRGGAHGSGAADRPAAENSQVAKPPAPRPADPRFPASLPNAPFDLATYVPPEKETGDLLGNFYAERKQIDGGKMDRFVSAGNSGALPMGYYDASKLPMGQIAKRFTLDDHFFHGAYGGSFLNHEFLISASPLRWPGAPDSVRAQVAPGGTLIRNGAVSPDGWVVNTAYPKDGPHPAATNLAELVPPQTGRTIGDELSAKGISWAWYSGGWKAAAAGHPGPLFQFNHQPFAYFKKFALGTKAQREHLLD